EDLPDVPLVLKLRMSPIYPRYSKPPRTYLAKRSSFPAQRIRPVDVIMAIGDGYALVKFPC
ncbi:MAG: hypothetical protein WCH07_09230, partial [Deltaproteobacteria bacterium]